MLYQKYVFVFERTTVNKHIYIYIYVIRLLNSQNIKRKNMYATEKETHICNWIWLRMLFNEPKEFN